MKTKAILDPETIAAWQLAVAGSQQKFKLVFASLFMALLCLGFGIFLHNIYVFGPLLRHSVHRASSQCSNSPQPGVPSLRSVPPNSVCLKFALYHRVLPALLLLVKVTVVGIRSPNHSFKADGFAAA